MIPLFLNDYVNLLSFELKQSQDDPVIDYVNYMGRSGFVVRSKTY